MASLKLSESGLPYRLMNPQLAEGVTGLANTTWVGGDFTIAGLFRQITGQSSAANVNAGDIVNLWIELIDLSGIEMVWAVVETPDYVPSPLSPNLESPQVELPVFTLSEGDGNGRYEGSFGDFIYNGEYRFIFYARNDNGNVSISPATVISVTGGENVTPVKGDINGDRLVNQTDSDLVLKVMSGKSPSGIRNDYETSGADVNGDNKVGTEELIYIKEILSGVRLP